MADAPAAPAPAAPAATSSTSESGSAAAPDSTAAAPQAPAWKPPPLKVYGSERVVDTDVYHRYAQQGAMFDHQRQEIAREKAAHEAQVRAWKERFKADPAAALREAEVDPDAWAAERLVSEHQRKQETPEQKEAREAKEERDRLKKALEEREKADFEAKVTAERERRVGEMGRSFSKALEGLGLTGSSGWAFVEHMANDWSEADELLQAGRITPEEHQRMQDPNILAKLAVEAVRGKVVAVIGRLRGYQALQPVLGDELIDVCAEAWVQREEAKRASAAAQTGAGAVPQGQQRPAYQNNGNGRERDANGQFVPAAPSRARSMFEEITGIRRG